MNLPRARRIRQQLERVEGAQTWIAGIALAHNLQRIALLT
jgi:hypothetical protein